VLNLVVQADIIAFHRLNCLKNCPKDLGIYRRTLLHGRDRDSKNMHAYNEFAYKNTKDCHKLEDRFQKNDPISIAYMQNRR
jgi:hypothetical protein